ncbi:uncharacterized protein LOC141899858 [Tubulanus polymorphus]|uniref:uncharacterized protein LOC141899858 n=1 Tax=Tubulanus polymorphus TaxID=672921 RepID=UPI003DA1FC7E
MKPNILLFKSYFLVYPLLTLAKPLNHGRSKGVNKFNRQNHLKSHIAKQQVDNIHGLLENNKTLKKLPTEIIDADSKKELDSSNDDDEDATTKNSFGANQHVPNLYHSQNVTNSISVSNISNDGIDNNTANLNISTFQTVNRTSGHLMTQFVNQTSGHLSQSVNWTSSHLSHNQTTGHLFQLVNETSSHPSQLVNQTSGHLLQTLNRTSNHSSQMVNQTAGHPSHNRTTDHLSHNRTTDHPATVLSTVISNSTIDQLLQNLLDNNFVQKMMGRRSKDAVWAALCLGFILCLLVIALFCSKPWRDPYQQSWLHDRPDYKRTDNLSVSDVLKSKRKYLPKLSLKIKDKKATLKKKKSKSPEYMALMNSDTDSEDFHSI